MLCKDFFSSGYLTVNASNKFHLSSTDICSIFHRTYSQVVPTVTFLISLAIGSTTHASEINGASGSTDSMVRLSSVSRKLPRLPVSAGRSGSFSLIPFTCWEFRFFRFYTSNDKVYWLSNQYFLLFSSNIHVPFSFLEFSIDVDRFSRI